MVIGVNHRGAATLLRERLQGDEADVARLLAGAAARGLGQAVAIATRDRCEFWCVAADPAKAKSAALGAIAEAADVDSAEISAQAVELTGRKAIRHAFAVAATLEAQIEGESESLEEIKALHDLARRLGASGADLDAVMAAALHAGEEARQGLGEAGEAGAMAASAVDVLRRLHGDVGKLGALLIGDGDLGQVIHDQMSGIGVTHWTAMHPQDRRAKAWAEKHRRHWRPFAELAEALADSDLVVTALDLGRETVSATMVETALRKRRRRPMLFIDLAVPGDIARGVDHVDDAYLFGIEDLEKLATQSRSAKARNSDAAWRVVDEAVRRFEMGERAWAIEALRRHFEDERAVVMRETGLSAEQATAKLVERLLRRPADALKANAPELELAIQRLFDLSDRKH